MKGHTSRHCPEPTSGPVRDWVQDRPEPSPRVARARMFAPLIIPDVSQYGCPAMSLGARIGRKEGLEPNLLQGYVLRSADRRDHREVAHLKTILGEMNRQYWEVRRTKIGRPPPW